PSTAEGYGYPPLEAMACGIPAIVSNIPVLKETTGLNALTADPSRPNAWEEAIEALGKNDIYENQREKGLQWVKQLRGRKGWQKHIEDIEELLSY
ncbi:glycosyltransferase, partial [Thermodesulfobacteriota bacterium]